MKTIVFMVLSAGLLAGQAQISDSRALELVFMTTCTLPMHTQNERTMRAAHLKRYRFSDEHGVAALLTAHCQQYQTMIDKHNKEVQKEFEETIRTHRDYNPPLDEEFQLSIAAQVNDTANHIKRAYPADYEHFMTAVQDEKQNSMAHYADTPMMPGQASKGPHVHPAPKMNAQGAIGSYSDYGYTVYDSFYTNGYTGWYTMAIAGASQISYFCVWDNYHGQWQPPPCPNVYHTPTVSMVVSGGAPVPTNETFTIRGSSLLPNQYMSWSVSNHPTSWNFYGPSKPRLTISGTISLFCTLAGVLINWPRYPSFAEAYTKGYVPANTIPFPASCPAQNWCTKATTPPYYNFTTLIPLTPSACTWPYWDGYETYISYAHSAWREYGQGAALTAQTFEKGTCDTAYSMPVP